jgi:hypothetical protein
VRLGLSVRRAGWGLCVMDDPRNNGAGTRKQMPEGKRFEPGNPGRPKGSRNKLGEDFIRALHDDFEEHGVAAIQTMRADKPHEYVKVIASLLPKELKVTTESDLTDDQLIERIQKLDAIIRPFLGIEGESAAGDGSEASLRPN